MELYPEPSPIAPEASEQMWRTILNPPVSRLPAAWDLVAVALETSDLLLTKRRKDYSCLVL